MSFFGCNIQTCAETVTGGVSRKKVLLRFENVKLNKSYIDDDKNIQKLLRIRLLGFLYGDRMKILQNPSEILVNEKYLFLIKFLANNMQMQ